jgi:hypothetical protein
MRNHRPQGTAVLKWEADTLKVRAFEMVLVLFYIQELREFILQSIEGTDWLRSRLDSAATGEQVSRLPKGNALAKEGKKLDRARERLVAEGVIDQTESDELFSLLDYRNSIGHAVQRLTGDVGAYAHLGKADPETYEPVRLYDYTAAKRARALSDKIKKGMMRSFVLTVGFSGLQFEAAEKTYLAEVERLKKRINKSVQKANKQIAETNQLIRSIPDSVLKSADPGHPTNLRENGSLTSAGRRCAFELFDAGATALAVAYLMRISLRSAAHWCRHWKAHSVEPRAVERSRVKPHKPLEL